MKHTPVFNESVDDLIRQLSSNPWAWVILSLCTILSVILAIYFGIKSIQRKTIRVLVFNYKLISNQQTEYSKLKVLYDNKEVEQLNVITVTFWNSSLPTIYDTDIITTAPFSISLIEGSILDVSVLRGNDTPNSINVLPLNNKMIKITFEYLDKGEGGIIQIISTGEYADVSISEKIKGGKIKIDKKSTIQFMTMIISLIAIIFFLFLYAFFSKHKYSNIVFDFSTTLILIVIIRAYLLCRKEPFLPKNCRK